MQNVQTERSSDKTHTADADNAAATATFAAVADQSHYITGVAGGFSAAIAGKKLILKHGTTTLYTWLVHNSLAVELPSPIKLPPNTVANLELAASGAGGTIGTASLKGYTL